MKKLYLLLAIVCLIAPMRLFAAEGPNEVEQAFAKAFNANDIDAIVALYSDDAVMYPPDTMIAKGKAEIKQGYAGLMNQFTISDFAITEAHHETTANMSVGWGQWQMTLTPKSGGQPQQMAGRFTDVSKKIGGKWLYVADHASLPLPPQPQTAK